MYVSLLTTTPLQRQVPFWLLDGRGKPDIAGRSGSQTDRDRFRVLDQRPRSAAAVPDGRLVEGAAGRGYRAAMSGLDDERFCRNRAYEYPDVSKFAD